MRFSLALPGSGLVAMAALLVGCGETHGARDASTSMDGSVPDDPGSPADPDPAPDAGSGTGGGPRDAAVTDARMPEPSDPAADASTGDGGAAHPADRLAASLNDLFGEMCDCPRTLGSRSSRDCRETWLFSDDDRACLRDVYDAHPDELEDVFGCLADAADEGAQCARDASSCASIDSCFSEFEHMSEACPMASESTEQELEKCVEPAPSMPTPGGSGGSGMTPPDPEP